MHMHTPVFSFILPLSLSPTPDIWFHPQDTSRCNLFTGLSQRRITPKEHPYNKEDRTFVEFCVVKGEKDAQAAMIQDLVEF